MGELLVKVEALVRLYQQASEEDSTVLAYRSDARVF
jgi:hypothetical protein